MSGIRNRLALYSTPRALLTGLRFFSFFTIGRSGVGSIRSVFKRFFGASEGSAPEGSEGSRGGSADGFHEASAFDKALSFRAFARAIAWATASEEALAMTNRPGLLPTKQDLLDVYTMSGLRCHMIQTQKQEFLPKRPCT